jgi:hypothetical protein
MSADSDLLVFLLGVVLAILVYIKDLRESQSPHERFFLPTAIMTIALALVVIDYVYRHKDSVYFGGPVVIQPPPVVMLKPPSLPPSKPGETATLQPPQKSVVKVFVPVPTGVRPLPSTPLIEPPADNWAQASLPPFDGTKLVFFPIQMPATITGTGTQRNTLVSAPSGVIATAH